MVRMMSNEVLKGMELKPSTVKDHDRRVEAGTVTYEYLKACRHGKRVGDEDDDDGGDDDDDRLDQHRIRAPTSRRSWFENDQTHY